MPPRNLFGIARRRLRLGLRKLRIGHLHRFRRIGLCRLLHGGVSKRGGVVSVFGLPRWSVPSRNGRERLRHLLCRSRKRIERRHNFRRVPVLCAGILRSHRRLGYVCGLSRRNVCGHFRGDFVDCLWKLRCRNVLPLGIWRLR